MAELEKYAVDKIETLEEEVKDLRREVKKNENYLSFVNDASFITWHEDGKSMRIEVPQSDNDFVIVRMENGEYRLTMEKNYDRRG